MKNWKKFLSFLLVVTMVLSMSACGEETVEPTPTPSAQPTNTVAPKPTNTTAPKPTDVPVTETVKGTVLYDYNAEQKAQTLYFGARGGGAIFQVDGSPNGTGKSVFKVTGRTSAWHGVSLSLKDPITMEPYDVIGKFLHVSFWAYQESGTDQTICATLQGMHPDGATQCWPSNVPVLVPSGTWTLVEGDLEVFSDITSPSINFESIDTDGWVGDFFIDDLKIVLLDEGTAGLKYPDYVPPVAGLAASLGLNFEDGEAYVKGRGDSSGKVVSDVAYEGKNSLYVSGRTATWNGVQIAYKKTDMLAGQTIDVDFWAYVTNATTVKCSLQQDFNSGAATTYTDVCSAMAEANTWTHIVGSVAVDPDCSIPVFSFEAPDSASADYYLDNIQIIIAGQEVVWGGAKDSAPVAEAKLSFDFEGDDTGFTKRGDGTPSIAKDIFNGGAASMFVSGRTSTWNGAGYALDDYKVAGATISVDFMAYNPTDHEIEIKASAEVKVAGETGWPNIAGAKIASKSWGNVKGEFTFDDATESALFYFECPTDNSDFYIDDAAITLKFPTGTNLNFDFEGEDTGFSKRGDGTPSIAKDIFNGGAASMFVSGRTSTWNGAGLALDDLKVAGGTLTVDFMAYNPTDHEIEIKASAEVKVAGETGWPNIAGAKIAPSTWVNIKGEFEFDAATESALFYFECPTDNSDFYIDDVKLHFEPASGVNLSFDFEGDDTGFAKRGDGTPSIAKDIFNGGAASMFVSGRTSTWNGAGLALDDYKVAGGTLSVDFMAYNPTDHEIEIKASAEVKVAGETGWPNIAGAKVAPSTWVNIKGEFEFDAATESALFYFECPTDNSDFYIDDVKLHLELAGAASEEIEYNGANPAQTADFSAGSIVYQNSFENAADPGSWLDGANSYNYASVENAVGIAHTGNESVKVVGRSESYGTNSGTGLRMNKTNGLSIKDMFGKTIKFSAWVYFEDAGYNKYADTIDFVIWNRLNVVNADATDEKQKHEIVLTKTVKKGEWTLLECELLIKDNTDNGMILIGTDNETPNAAGNYVSYYVDDMQITIVK